MKWLLNNFTGLYAGEASNPVFMMNIFVIFLYRSPVAAIISHRTLNYPQTDRDSQTDRKSGRQTQTDRRRADTYKHTGKRAGKPAE